VRERERERERDSEERECVRDNVKRDRERVGTSENGRKRMLERDNERERKK
jgi:hypothetical protein